MKAIRLTKHLQTGVWAIQLHRPERLNALSEQMAEELCTVLSEASKGGECRGVLIEGDERSFSTGRDLKLSREHTPEQSRRYLDLAVSSVIALLDCEVPTAVAVRGHCIGWGMEFALAADIRFADETAKFRLPETSLGLFPGAGTV